MYLINSIKFMFDYRAVDTMWD